MLLKSFAVSILISLVGGGAFAQANPLQGYWRMDSPMQGMQAIVELYNCGEDAVLCGNSPPWSGRRSIVGRC